MAECMGRHPGITDMQAFTVPLEELDQRMVAQGFSTSFASTSHEKDVGTLRLCWALEHDVITHRLERLGLEKINHALRTGLRPGTFGMVGAVANDHTPSSILEILQVQREDFTRSETAMEHQKEHGLVAPEFERV